MAQGRRHRDAYPYRGAAPQDAARARSTGDATEERGRAEVGAEEKSAATHRSADESTPREDVHGRARGDRDQVGEPKRSASVSAGSTRPGAGGSGSEPFAAGAVDRGGACRSHTREIKVFRLLRRTASRIRSAARRALGRPVPTPRLDARARRLAELDAAVERPAGMVPLREALESGDAIAWLAAAAWSDQELRVEDVAERLAPALDRVAPGLGQELAVKLLAECPGDGVRIRARDFHDIVAARAERALAEIDSRRARRSGFIH